MQLIDYKYKIGLRAIKTVVVVMACMIVAELLGRDDAFYSSIGAIVCLQPTYEETFTQGINRVIGTAIGGLFGYAILELCQFVPYYEQFAYLIVIPICVLILIYVCNVLKARAAVSICCIVFLGIALLPENTSDTLSYVTNRVIDTTVGIVLAMIANRFFVPKKQVQQEEVIKIK